MTDWKPPYCATDTELDCPACKASESVCVREQSTVFDGDEVEAFCSECHRDLHVTAFVQIEYTDPELA